MKSTVLLCVLALAACSQKAPEPQATQPKQETAGTATPWDGLKKDEQRARDVQKTVDQQAAEQRRQIEAAEQ
jgi:predicted small lipoprotein YifL